MNIISDIKQNLLTISCVDPNTEQVYAHIKKQWEGRFSSFNAYWLDMYACDFGNLADMLREEAEKTGLPWDFSMAYQLSVFFDMRSPLNETHLDAIASFYKGFDSDFQASIQYLMFYCYVGRYNGSNDVPQVKENIQLLLDRFDDARLCLVGETKPGADQGACWIPVMAFMDVLRRAPEVMEDYALNQRVGYLQYRFYQEALRAQQEQKHKKLSCKLREESIGQIRHRVESQLEALDERIRQDYNIIAAYQPIHPGLQVTRGFSSWLKRLCGDSFETAAKASRYAIEHTARRIKNEIDAYYDMTEEQADALFEKMIEDIGLQSLSNGTVAKELEFQEEPRTKNESIMLNDSEDNEENIQSYLNTCIENARNVGHIRYRRALQAACAKHARSHDYAQQLLKDRKDFFETSEYLRRLPDFDSFCRDSVELEKFLLGHVRLQGRGSSIQICLYEGEDEQISQRLDSASRNGSDLDRRVFACQIPKGFNPTRTEIPAMMLKFALTVTDSPLKKEGQ